MRKYCLKNDLLVYIEDLRNVSNMISISKVVLALYYFVAEHPSSKPGNLLVPLELTWKENIHRSESQNLAT